MKKAFRWIIILLVMVAAGELEAEKEFERSPGKDEISCSLEVSTEEGQCLFIIRIVNNSAVEVVLEFPTAQMYNIIVESDEGEIEWQWAQNRMFPQVVTIMRLGKGEKRQFTEEHDLPAGEYRARAIIAAKDIELASEWVPVAVGGQKMAPLTGKVTNIMENWYLLGDDGTAYHIENPSPEIKNVSGTKITVTSYRIENIPGTIDKKVVIEEYRQ